MSLDKQDTGSFSVMTDDSVSVTNSNVETTFFSYPIPAGAMGTKKRLRFELFGVLTTPLLTVGNTTLTTRIKLGAVILTLSNNTGLISNLASVPVKIVVDVKNTSATTQKVVGEIRALGGSISGTVTSSRMTSTVDTTVPQTFGCSIQFGGTLLALGVPASFTSDMAFLQCS